MTVIHHPELKCLLNAFHGSIHIEDHPIRMLARYSETLRLNEANQRIIIGFAGTELLGKLIRGEIAPELRALRVSDIAYQRIEFFPVPQPQADCKSQVS